MEETNNRKPASKAFVLSLFTITIILILLLFFIFCKMMPRGGFDIDSISVRQDSGEIQYQYSGGDWKKIISLDELRGKDGRSIEVQKGSLYIQWRYTGDSEWKNVIAYSDLLKGRMVKTARMVRMVRTVETVLTARMAKTARMVKTAATELMVLQELEEPRELPVRLVLQGQLAKMLLFP